MLNGELQNSLLGFFEYCLSYFILKINVKQDFDNQQKEMKT